MTSGAAALARFQIEGYVRSLRALYPMIPVALIELILMAEWPSGPHVKDLATAGFGDTAAFLFPLAAWAARSLLDTEPDVQRQLSTLAVGGRRRAALASLGAGYVAALGVSAGLLSLPLLAAVTRGLPADTIAYGVLLHLMVAAAATVFGALLSRAIIPSPAISILLLLGGPVLLLVMSMGPLRWLSIPEVRWMSAAEHGAGPFARALPATSLHLLLWTVAVGAIYVALRRIRH